MDEFGVLITCSDAKVDLFDLENFIFRVIGGSAFFISLNELLKSKQ